MTLELECGLVDWRDEYSNMRTVPNFGECGLIRNMFTVGVCYRMDDIGPGGRFCFDSWSNAALFLKEWDGTYYPTVGEDGCTAIK